MSQPRISNVELAALLKQCAEALDNEDKRAYEAGETRWKGVAGEWSTKGQEICIQTAGPVFGDICYYLLGGAWNDILDWADKQQGVGFSSTRPNEEDFDGSSHEGGHQ